MVTLWRGIRTKNGRWDAGNCCRWWLADWGIYEVSYEAISKCSGDTSANNFSRGARDEIGAVRDEHMGMALRPLSSMCATGWNCQPRFSLVPLHLGSDGCVMCGAIKDAQLFSGLREEQGTMNAENSSNTSITVGASDHGGGRRSARTWCCQRIFFVASRPLNRFCQIWMNEPT